MENEKITTLGFPLRFKTEKQKIAIKKIAGKNNRSLNAEINHLVDMKILAAKTKGSSETSTAATVYLTKEQAQQLIDTLQAFIS